MGIQGGSQFRAANTAVDESNVPSKLNNYAFDVNYTVGVTDTTSLLLGSSYLHGSPYCQEFPVTHFSACDKRNSAWDAYAQLNGSNWMLQAEYAETSDEWPGTFNPTIPQYSASDVNSWDLGGRYTTDIDGYRVDWSLDFSRFVAGPSGSPWEKQDQIVLGVAGYITPSVKLFGELIRTEGYAPLNFISGGNLGAGVTHSDDKATSNILMLGANVAF